MLAIFLVFLIKKLEYFVSELYYITMNQEQDSIQNEVGMTEEDHKDWFLATGLEDAGKEIKIFITKPIKERRMAINPDKNMLI